MNASNARYAFIALIVFAVLNTGCQKGAGSSIRAKKGAPGAINPLNPSEQKLDELVQKGKSIPICSKGIQEKNKALKTEVQATQKVIEESKINKESEEVKKSLELHSNQVEALLKAVLTEFVKEDISSCGRGSSLASIDSLRSLADETFIAIADALGKDIPASSVARQKHKDKKEETKKSESLVGQKLKPTKELLEVLDEQNQHNFLFIANGEFANKKENYQKALDASDTGVCLLEKAPVEKLKEGSVLNIMEAETTLTEVSDQTAVVKKTFQLFVRATSADQLLILKCRLGKDPSQQSASQQFLKIFGSLLVDQSATSNLN